uniref:Neural cell adhesion molecule 1a n=1 Tax=Poecilia reticulata TaxID=8081 RepID=A0A3P9PN36_POERE
MLHSSEPRNFIPEFHSQMGFGLNIVASPQNSEHCLILLWPCVTTPPDESKKKRKQTNVYFSVSSFLHSAAIQVQITPAQGEISVGESKFFLCEVVGDAKDIDWFSPSGEKILLSRPNISVSRSDESTSILTIYHANVDNAGIYKCLAKNADKEAQATVQVKIFQKITFQSAPSPQEFNEGDNADIVCDVVSSPPPTIIWKHKGSKLQSAKDVRYKIMDNGHLLIRGIKKVDEGMYNCEARVMARGEIDFRTIKVIVNVLPTIRARKSEVNATADVGESALLACDADGFPEPTVTWAHNNIVLETGDKYSLNEDGSELVIKEVRKVDEGDYTCIAKNKAGEKTEEVSLNVFVLPNITYFNNQTASEFDEEVTLTCEASGDPTPTISWRFGNRVFTEGEQASWTRPDKYESLDRNVVVRSHARVSSLTLKDVQFTDAGRYLCTASNSIGEDNQQLFLEVRYSPKIMGLVTAHTWEGNPANISCEVAANPRASVVWFRDGMELPTANSTNIKIFNTPTISLLEITPESQNDFGSYNCTATNVIGSESKEFILIQAEVPSSPKIEEVQPFSSTAVVEFEEPNSLGGVPILKYRVEWRLPGKEWKSEEYKAEDDMTRITIVGLKPETTYEVKMSAINGKGEGESSRSSTFKTEPVHTADGGSGLGTGAIVGILIVVFLLLLVAVDVTCYFLNKCGLLMCIAVNVCGKAGPGAKSKDIEEGKAAFSKDESKEPIVEVRTEEENTANQEGGGPTEPNETTPLTEPEPAAADSPNTAVNQLPPAAANSVTGSVSTPQTNSSPKNTAAALSHSPKAECSVGPLVDLSDAPKVAPASSPPVLEPVSPPSTNGDRLQNPCESVRTPSSTQSKDLQVDGQSNDARCAPCSDSTTSTQNDGKTVKSDNAKAEPEVKNATAEVKTVPNEAPQANGNESKA